jgi:Fe-S-cluster-containing hydrogenase component 2
MTSALVIEPDKCTSCRLCELACSERNGGRFRPSVARIRVAIHADDAFYFPAVCVQCDDAPCIPACPTQALVRDATTGAVVVVAEKCDDCGECEPACPYGAIRCRDGRAEKCELCGGEPECVKFCAPGALRFEPRATWPPAQRQAYLDRMMRLVREVSS